MNDSADATGAGGILLGIKLLFIGLIMVTAGSAVRTIAKELDKSS